jgi:hypothetical protein
VADHVGDLVAVVAIRVAQARRDDDRLAGRGLLPPAAGEEARATFQDLEALLDRRMDVRRHASAGLDPDLDVEHLAAVVVDGLPEAEPLAEDRILDHALVHVISIP